MAGKLIRVMSQVPSILLVDDDDTTNFLNQALIRRAQVTDRILVATNGLEALRALHDTCTPVGAQCPALILLDVNMPVMNGIEFLEAYQKAPLVQQQDIVIVLLTTTVLTRDLERVQQLPIASVLDKPLTSDKLRLLVDRHFPIAAA
jgi:CheY-like chemotaxis protein